MRLKQKTHTMALSEALILLGMPGILTFIDKNIKPLIFKLFWLCKNNSAVDNSKKLKHEHKITPRA
jgi:hypothetical protein